MTDVASIDVRDDSSDDEEIGLGFHEVSQSAVVSAVSGEPKKGLWTAEVNKASATLCKSFDDGMYYIAGG